MGNLSFIIPTQNLQDYNKIRIQELLTEHILNGQFPISPEWNEIGIYKKGDDPVKLGPIANLYFGQDCYVLNFERDITELRKQDNQKLATGLEELQKLNIDYDNIIQMTHALEPNQKIKRDAEIFLHKHFKAYILDEGIHPEYIGPDYVYKKLKKW